MKTETEVQNEVLLKASKLGWRCRMPVEFKISDKPVYKGYKELAVKEARKHTPDGWVSK